MCIMKKKEGYLEKIVPDFRWVCNGETVEDLQLLVREKW